MEFDDLGRFRAPLEAGLRTAFREERRRAGRAFRPYLEAVEEFTLRGGKRFRALLLLAGYWIATGKDPTPALPAAAALEQFQSWMLIHDDIIDHAETRRGGPTLHRAFAGRFPGAEETGTADAFGTGIGITLGDLEEPFTVDGLLAAPAPPARTIAALREYVRMTRETAYGQLLDIANGARPVGEVSERDVLTVHRLKSAVYTVAAPLRLGAILGGARPALLADLDRIGLDVGTAFQLRDDVLGAGFDDGGSGKSANDLVEGKRTLLVVRAWTVGSEGQRAALARVLGRPGATPAEVDAAREAIRATGSLDYSERRIRALHRRALRRIGSSRALRAPARPLLSEIAERLIHRSV